MDELGHKLINEVCNMRLEIVYKRLLEERTVEAADKE